MVAITTYRLVGVKNVVIIMGAKMRCARTCAERRVSAAAAAAS